MENKEELDKIMDAKKAKEIIKGHGEGSVDLYSGAVYYLEALEGPEVKALVKAHEAIVSLANSYGDIPMPQSTYLCAEESVKALAQYREAVK